MIRASSSAGLLLRSAGTAAQSRACQRVGSSADGSLKLVGSEQRQYLHVCSSTQRELKPKRSDRGSSPGGSFSRGKFQNKQRPPPKLAVPDKVLTRIWAAQDTLDAAASANRNAVEAEYGPVPSEVKQSTTASRLGAGGLSPGDFIEIRRNNLVTTAIILPLPSAGGSQYFEDSDGEVGDDTSDDNALWALNSSGELLNLHVSDVMFSIPRVVHPRLATAARPADAEAAVQDAQLIVPLDTSQIAPETLTARSFILGRLRSIESSRDSEIRRLLPAFQREYLVSSFSSEEHDTQDSLAAEPHKISTTAVHKRLSGLSTPRPTMAKKHTSTSQSDSPAQASEWSIPPRVSEQISLLATHTLLMAHPERFIADERSHRETGLFLRRSDAERLAWAQVQKWFAEERSRTLKTPISKPAARRISGNPSPTAPPSPIATFCQKAASVRVLRKSMLKQLETSESSNAASGMQPILDPDSSDPIEWTDDDRTILTFLLSTVGSTRKIQDEIFGSLAMSIVKRAGGAPVIPTVPFAADESTQGSTVTDDNRRVRSAERMDQLKLTARNAGISSPMNLLHTGGLVPSFVTEFLIEIGVLAPWTNMRRLNNSLLSTLNGLPEVQDEALTRGPESQAMQLPEPETVERTDFGQLPVYVIDDAAAHELDDGVSIEKTSDPQEWWIHVHIADPTAVLKPESPLSLRASHMVSTLYFPEVHYPLFPQSFTHQGVDMGSLRRAGTPSDATQRAMTFSARINETSGQASDYKITPSLVRNIRVCSYENVQNIFDGVGGLTTDLRQSEQSDLLRLRKVAEALGRRRVRGGMFVTRQVSADVSVSKTAAIDGSSDISKPHFYHGFPQVNVKLVRQADVVPGSTSMTMVSELMILAGQVMGAWAQDHDVPMVYRGHSFGSPAELANARQVIMSVLQKDRERETGAIDLGAILQINRVLPFVVSSDRPLPHMAMGLGFSPSDGATSDALGTSGYVRCTSPLRRYADMITHWQVHAGLRALARGEKPSEKVPWSREMLSSHMDRISRMESWQRFLQRISVRYWQSLHLRHLLNLVSEGKESSLSPADRALLQPSRATVIDSRVRAPRGSSDGMVQVTAEGIGQTAACEWGRHEAPPVAGQELMVKVSFVHIAGPSSQIVVRRV
ncbi:3'-5' RNA exonuclease complex component [Tilletia horrida]|uniref:3'-5' RNA exonuclease complex component n=1 Tax=Tilletia horrida TaxID=155126 RepID=A0AAN6H1L3_9BASI|nr:3'-5' RNA exonuclease complex component [Tilletia horrida]